MKEKTWNILRWGGYVISAVCISGSIVVELFFYSLIFMLLMMIFLLIEPKKRK